MFLNAAGQPEEVEAATLTTGPEDRRSAGLMRWIQRLVGNSSADLSFEAITSALYTLMGKDCWVREVFDRYAIWTDASGRLWRQDYTVSSSGSVAFAGTAIEVSRKVEYEPINNREDDPVKQQILAALNAAGIDTAGLDDDKLLAAYNAHITQPVAAKLTAANSKLAEIEIAANAAADAELTTIATALAVNTSLTVADFKAMGLARCKELQANAAKAAPVLPGTTPTPTPADEFASYSINALMEQK
jgi:hypothetical protein